MDPLGGQVQLAADDPARSVPAAVLAAAAESGVLFLAIQAIAVEAGRASAGPLTSFPLFVALFVGGVAAATLGRRSAAVPVVAIAVALAVGLAQGAWLGSGSLTATAGMVVMALAVTLRVVSLARRDWRNPIDISLFLGTVALVVEILVAESVGLGWSGMLYLIVPAFFLCSLASRALSIRLATGVAARAEDERRWTSLAVRPLVFLAAVMGLGVALSGQRGALERLGSLIYPIFSLTIDILAQLLRPLFWLIERLPVNLDAVQRLIDRLRRAGERRNQRMAPPPAPGTIARVIGLLILIALAYLLVRLIRRYRPRLAWHQWQEEPIAEARLAWLPPRRRPAPRSHPPRRELPEDTVRRWYAEALTLLEDKGIPRPAWRTPGEYLPVVALAFPDSGTGFEALTRAYEDVRYGRRRLDRTRLSAVGVERDRFMNSVRESERAEPAED